MLARFHHWLHAISLHDPLKQRQAMMVQIMLLSLVAISCLSALIPLIVPLPRIHSLMTAAIILSDIPIAVAALIILRRRHFMTSVLLTTTGLITILSIILFLTSLESDGALLFAFAIPIAIAGLLLSRSGLLLTIGISIFGISTASILVALDVPLSGALAFDEESTVGMIGGFVLVSCVLGLFLDRFSRTLQQALAQNQLREQELDRLRESLEYTVDRRTQELRRVLEEVQTRAAEQERLLAENEQQRAAIRELSVPVLPVNPNTMVMPLVGTLDQERLLLLEERALQSIQRSSARQLFLDITGVPFVDNQVAEGMLRMVQAARLLGAEVVLVGVRPEVAQAIVSLGIDLGEMRAYGDLQTALKQAG